MRSSFRLDRVAGVEIDAHWSWLLVVALIVWSLAAGVSPEPNPDLSDAAYIAMAVAAAILFFGSLLLHELGHRAGSAAPRAATDLATARQSDRIRLTGSEALRP